MQRACATAHAYTTPVAPSQYLLADRAPRSLVRRCPNVVVVISTEQLVCSCVLIRAVETIDLDTSICIPLVHRYDDSQCAKPIHTGRIQLYHIVLCCTMHMRARECFTYTYLRVPTSTCVLVRAACSCTRSLWYSILYGLAALRS